jgi:hypothetical protein
VDQSLTSTVDVIQKVSVSLEKQATSNENLKGKLDVIDAIAAIAVDGVTKDDLGGLKKEIQHIREQIQGMSATWNHDHVRQLVESVAASRSAAAYASFEAVFDREAAAALDADAASAADAHNPDPTSLDGPPAALGDEDNGEREAKRKKTAERDSLSLSPYELCHPLPVQPSDGNERTPAQVAETESPVHILLLRLGPDQHDENWEPDDILQGIYALRAEYPKAAEAILDFIDSRPRQQWYCARSVASGWYSGFAPRRVHDGTCWYCEKECVQIKAMETDPLHGPFRVRLVRGIS